MTLKKRNLKVYLVSNLEGVPLHDNKIKSIEAGYNDDVNHFDHHRGFAYAKSPCNRDDIPVVDSNTTIYVSHMDTDTFLGLFRLLRGTPSNTYTHGDYKFHLNTELLEKLDCNGTSICKDKTNDNLAFFIGVTNYARKIGFPRVSSEAQDVTDYVQQLLDTPFYEFLQFGKSVIEKSEASYVSDKVTSSGNVILFDKPSNSSLDPSRPYEDGFDLVVVYNQAFKSISLYASPNYNITLSDKEYAGILFQGRAKACGSPRGVEYTLEDAKKVFEDLASRQSSSLKLSRSFSKWGTKDVY